MLNDDFTEYKHLKREGLSAIEIYKTGKTRGLDNIALLRLLRYLFQYNLVEAKEIMIIAEGRASSLEEYQETLFSGLENAFKEDEEQKESDRYQT